eukprot:729976_1
MSMMLYDQYTLDHLYHHKYSCTPEDSASAPFGMSFWTFLRRRLVLSHKHAMCLSATIWRRIVFGQLSIIFIAQAVLSQIQLETLNYMWHYGYDVTGEVAWEARYLDFVFWNTHVHREHHKNAAIPISK